MSTFRLLHQYLNTLDQYIYNNRETKCICNADISPKMMWNCKDSTFRNMSLDINLILLYFQILVPFI